MCCVIWGWFVCSCRTCFATACGAYHEYVLGDHLVAHVVPKLMAPPPVPQCNCDCALGVRLPYDVAVQSLYHLARLQCTAERVLDRQLYLHNCLCLGFWGHGASADAEGASNDAGAVGAES
jgi:hypothetical protein